MRCEALAAATLALLFTSAGASECDDWQSKHPDWLWCDSFETVDSLRSYEDRKTTESNPDGMEIDAGTAFDGSASLRQSYRAGQVSAGWVIKVDDFPDDLFVRWYHKFAPGYSEFPPKMGRVGFRDRNTWKETMRVHLWFHQLPGGHALIADTLALDSSQANGSGWLAVEKSDHFVNEPGNTDRWVAYELQVKLNTPCQTDGLFRVWVDDQLVIERTGVDLRGCKTYGINEVMLDTYWNGGATGSLERHYDNLVISTARIGRMASLNPPRAPVVSVQ